MHNVVVIGSGAAGVMAAWRSAELGARTAILTSAEFGGMTAHDGPVPGRTLAHAARLMRDARQLSAYGISVGEPRLDYPSLLRRVREVAVQVADVSSRRADLDRMGVSIVEHAGHARFVDAHTVSVADGSRFESAAFVLCVGGIPRSLPVPGGELALTLSAAWAIEQPPGSMIVIGGGATGTQVASIFNAFGTRVELIQVQGRILPGGDEDVSAAVSDGFRQRGIRGGRCDRCGPAGSRGESGRVRGGDQRRQGIGRASTEWAWSARQLHRPRVRECGSDGAAGPG